MTAESAWFSTGVAMGDSDPSSTPALEVGRALMRMVHDCAQRVAEDPVGVNVVFWFDGRIKPLDFQGVEVGRFRRKDSVFVVNVAVPGGTEPEGLPKKLIALLKEAVHAVEKRVMRNHLAAGLPGAWKVVGMVEAETSLSDTSRVTIMHCGTPRPVDSPTTQNGREGHGSGPKLSANMGNGDTHVDPSESHLLLLLEDLIDFEVDPWIIVETIPAMEQVYAQALHMGDGVFQVERRLGGPLTHEIRSGLELDEAHELLTEWSFGLVG